MILVTGSSGLVGRHLRARMEQEGLVVRQFDLKRAPDEDVRNPHAVERALDEVSGIVHLAAVSRVIDGERLPEHCRQTNIGGLQTILRAALARKMPPWFVFVSSREVYGNAAVSPTDEDAELQALNNYARTKVLGEKLTQEAREAGLIANICRLSTVYGSTDDYADRALPAFCRAAALGGEIRVEGQEVALDPTHIDDVSQGLLRLAQRTAARDFLPPIHFVSGRGYSLVELARLAIAAGDPATRITMQPQRKYDVSKFIGDPGRARELLGWTAKITAEQGVPAFVRDFRNLLGSETGR